MSDTQYRSELLRVGILAATEAAQLIHDRVDTDFRVEKKAEGKYNLVTEMDTAAEETTQRVIRTAMGASARFLAEESGGEADLTPLTWVIDPIDGTVNYAHGIPIYSVSIAAVENNQPIAGVIINPSTKELFTATLGGGAFLNDVPLRVSTTYDLSESVLVTGFPYNVEDNPFDCIGTFARLLRMGIPIRRLGSAALDLAYLAAGRMDGYWEVSLGKWDVAAGSLLVTEAGGRVDTYGDASDQGALPTDRLLATNGHIHEILKAVLQNR